MLFPENPFNFNYLVTRIYYIEFIIFYSLERINEIKQYKVSASLATAALNTNILGICFAYSSWQNNVFLAENNAWDIIQFKCKTKLASVLFSPNQSRKSVNNAVFM